MIRRRVVVRGKVQGVFFRDSCQREAAEAGVAGCVRNRDDGAVEAVFEGDQEAVEAMCSWCRRGPSSADVSDVEVGEEPVKGEEGFQLRG